MSESASPAVPDHPSENHSGPLTPEAIERLLGDFRAWLTDLVSHGEEPASSPAVEVPDLHTLLGQMIAVRKEVTLQTRAVRAQTEQNAQALEVLDEAVKELEKLPRSAPPPQSPDDLMRPLIKTLIDTHDALSLACREAQRVQDTVLPLLDSLPPPPDLASVEMPPLEEPGRPFLARLLGVRGVNAVVLRDWPTQARAVFEKASADCWAACTDRAKQNQQRVREFLASLLTGYRMGLQRIERALAQNGLEPIAATGEPFDPERMEVLEAVDGAGRPAGEVLEEVRRGYLWRGRVFRYAQVRVARS
jgi:molecular chaperone GrpE